MRYLAAALLISFTGIAAAGQPVQNLDSLEKEIESCLRKEAKTAKCLESILGSRILPGNDELVRRRGLGKWYVLTFNVNSKAEALEEVLK